MHRNRGTDVVSYERISADTATDRHGVADQRKVNAETARRLGWTIVRQLRYSDLTASKATVVRPDFEGDARSAAQWVTLRGLIICFRVECCLLVRRARLSAAALLRDAGTPTVLACVLGARGTNAAVERENVVLVEGAQRATLGIGDQEPLLLVQSRDQRLVRRAR